jgi:hypothetical protein
VRVLGLFGRHVINRHHHRATRCQSVGRLADRIIKPRQAQVQDFHDPFVAEQQIGRLDVAMDNALPMRELQSACGLCDVIHGAAKDRRAVQPLETG